MLESRCIEVDELASHNWYLVRWLNDNALQVPPMFVQSDRPRRSKAIGRSQFAKNKANHVSLKTWRKTNILPK